MGCLHSAVENQSPSAIEKEIHHRKREESDLLVKEHEAPKENGERRSNGIEDDVKSDRIAERQPDVVDDRPSKSRSTFNSFSVFLFTCRFFRIQYFIKIRCTGAEV